ncbi:hypothetical protein ACWGH8_30250 [Nonomuraea muscovyensis]
MSPAPQTSQPAAYPALTLAVVGADAVVIAVPLTQPGLGHTIDEDRVRRMSKDHFQA